MASSEGLQIIDLDFDDVDAGLLLSDEANWNQIVDDWRLFIRHGRTIGFRNSEGQLIASAAALPYESTFGFISMVLVTRNWQRRGLATRLVDCCIKWLRQRQLVPVLDATNDGAKVYCQQGFNPLFELNRWQLETLPDSRSGSRGEKTNDAENPLHPVKSVDLQKLSQLDAEAVGARREFLISDFVARNNSRTFVTPDGTGFAIARRGRRAVQIGPVVAVTQNAAIELISRALQDTSGSVFIDVPKKAEQVGLWLKNRGFSIQRSFTRMALGTTRPFGAPERLSSSAGPEFG